MKQPFNLSQEKIDQLFRHCIFDLTPKSIGNKYMYYHTSDNAYRYRIQWTEKDDRSYHSYPCSDITEDLFESDNLKFRIIIYRTFEDTVFGAYPCTSIALEVSDLDFEELQKVTEAGASGSDLISSAAPSMFLAFFSFLFPKL